MKSRLFMLAVGLPLAFAIVASAADVSGKWTAQVPGRQGNTQETTFTLKADGEKLTGSVTGAQGNEIQIADGKVKGDEISFTTTMSRGGNEIKMTYKGKVAGDEIKFTRQREGGANAQEFTAKRAK
jgi:hypothetical protein